MAVALELHDELVARTADSHGGRLLKTKGEGDSTVTVFRRASDAVASTVELRDLLAGATWPEGIELRVRIAIHTGEAHERDGDYFGPALNRAARLRALASGTATLLSQATTEIVHDRLPPGTELIDLGSRDLRGLSRPEQVFELRTTVAGAGATGPAEHETRKTVTVLFACVIDSTSAAEAADAEARRRVRRALPRRHASRVRTARRDRRGISGRRADGRVRRAGAPRRRCAAGAARGGRVPGDAPGARRRTGRGLRRPAQHPHRARDRRGDRGAARLRAVPPPAGTR